MVPSPTAEEERAMRWNLRLAAANRGIWKAGELQRTLAEHGLVISAGKMSGLWSGKPASIKLDDLDVICAVLGCGVEELLIPEPDTVARPAADTEDHRAAASSSVSAAPVTPKRRDAGACAACQRLMPVKKGYCRLCWLQAAAQNTGGRPIGLRDLAQVRHQQLSLAGLNRIAHARPATQPEPATAPQHAPIRQADQYSGWTQPQLRAPGDRSRFDQR